MLLAVADGATGEIVVFYTHRVAVVTLPTLDNRKHAHPRIQAYFLGGWLWGFVWAWALRSRPQDLRYVV